MPTYTQRHNSHQRSCQAILYPSGSVFQGWIALEDGLKCQLEVSPLSQEKLRAQLSCWLGLRRLKATTTLYLASSEPAPRFAGNLVFGVGRYQVFARFIDDGPRMAVSLRPMHLHRHLAPSQLEIVE